MHVTELKLRYFFGMAGLTAYSEICLWDVVHIPQGVLILISSLVLSWPGSGLEYFGTPWREVDQEPNGTKQEVQSTLIAEY